MILNGHSTCGGQWVNYKTCKTKPLKAMSDCVLHPQTLSISRVSSSLKSQQELRSFSPQGLFTHKISPNLSRKRHSTVSPRASKDANSLFNFKFPPMDKKPRWWWRTLAALPYLMPLHETWMYAETAFHLHPFLEDFEELTYPFLSALGGLPSWFLIAYFIVAYLAVVRRKEWPHFFRFHVVTGMLLEITLQVTGTVWRWLPSAWYWGKVGMHFWTAFAFAFLFTVLECIRCCLAGVYADVPFVSEAAYIQIPYE
ncbi:Tic20-like protein [Cynara cardunculus var. scolymus]|uniref:Protein TIC 20 n=1 Tax=Cynara cardunculus var. scolymus TaxID=59895 RepID=A0A124SFV9_CYNCS|nr:Tic20-like protein [Cynara cardunculus var. scolymus]